MYSLSVFLGSATAVLVGWTLVLLAVSVVFCWVVCATASSFVIGLNIKTYEPTAIKLIIINAPIIFGVVLLLLEKKKKKKSLNPEN